MIKAENSAEYYSFMRTLRREKNQIEWKIPLYYITVTHTVLRLLLLVDFPDLLGNKSIASRAENFAVLKYLVVLIV